MSYLQQIIRQFPIRKKNEEKSAFRAWAVAQMLKMGYEARVEGNGRSGQHNNVVAGDPEKAQVVFTAHYDTPPVMPFPNLMMPRNPVIYYLYQAAVVLVLIVLAAALAFAAHLLFDNRVVTRLTLLGGYYLLLLLLIFGPANRHNANDNTSGVATVLSLMETLPEELRGEAAFILFDNEEKGKQGSKAYALAHPTVKKGTLVVNMDCVGVGEHILLIGKPLARAMADYRLLEESMVSCDGFTAHCYPSSGSVVNSDQASFRRGAVLCACDKKPVVGFITKDIHTPRDVRADEENVQYLTKRLRAFVEALKDA